MPGRSRGSKPSQIPPRPKPVKFRSAKSVIRNMKNKLGREVTVEDIKELLDKIGQVNVYDWGPKYFPEVFTGDEVEWQMSRKAEDKLYAQFIGPFKRALADEFLSWKQEEDEADRRKMLDDAIMKDARRIEDRDPGRAKLMREFPGLPGVTVEHLDYFDYTDIEITEESKESISTFSHTSAWSTTYTGKVTIQGKEFIWDVWVAGDVNRV